MDAFEFNKIAGVVLSALLIVFGGSTLIEEFAGHGPEEPVYQLAVVSQESGEAAGTETADAAEPAGDAFSFEQVAGLLQQASADQGKTQFRQCSACHTVDQGGANRVGPNLWNIIGRDIALVDAFSYSKVLAEMEGDWTYENLALFLHAPKEWAPGTKMNYPGLKSPQAVANMLAYLRTLSSEPAPLPEVAASGQ